jgi:transcriptional regulator with XRE-family HTH domain
MPRPPKFDHVVRKLRKIIGYTQAKLAADLGVAEITIKKIENGGLALSEQMKRRLMIATGVDPTSLDGKKPVFLGRPSGYTREMFEIHRENSRTRKRGAETAELRDWHRALLNLAAQEMDALLEAAVNANKFDMVLYLWELWLQQMIKDLDLSARFLQAVKKAGLIRTVKGREEVGSTTAFLLLQSARSSARQRRKA